MRRFLLTALLPVLAFGCNGDIKGVEGQVDSGVGAQVDEDGDNDGFNAEDDCNDGDAAVRPGAVELCDGIDNNCDGVVDEGVSVTYYEDADSDGYGNPETALAACERPEGFVPNGSDCDDTSAAAFPSGVEICDGYDNDCDGTIDEELLTTYYQDLDGDTFGDPSTGADLCEAPVGFVADGSDCNDSSSISFPGAAEVCDELDNDCDGDIDEDSTTIYYADTDGDGHGDLSRSVEACVLPEGYTLSPTDCDDADPLQNPDRPELCNSEDDDCDGTIDEPDAIDASTWYADTDGDTFGDLAAPTNACTQPLGFVADSRDCDDTNAAQYPAAPEYCNTEDDDCDGAIDEEDAVDPRTWYADADSDTFGNPAVTATACNPAAGYVGDNTDCDDARAATHPGADEYCNTLDDDCDGTIDEDDAVDAVALADDDDGDGFGAVGSTHPSCEGVDNELDCNDADLTEPLVVDSTYGSASGDGSSASPLDTIQAGIDAANECVVVFPGTYVEAIDFGGATLIVESSEGAAVTTINASGLGTAAVSFTSGEGADSVLRGFTITGGDGHSETIDTPRTCDSPELCREYTTTYCGGGLYIESSDPTLEGLVIEDNVLVESSSTEVDDDLYEVYSFGGGVCIIDSSADISDTVIEGNFADQGGGIWVDETSSVSFSHIELYDNTAADGAGVEVDGGSFTLSNSISAYNTADDVGGAFYIIDGGFTATNIVAAYDAATTGGELALAGAGTSTVMNSILAYAAGGEGVAAPAGTTFTGTYNNVFGNIDGEYTGTTDPTGSLGNLSVAPRFRSAATRDFTLLPASPSINAGDPDAAYNDVDGTRNNQGAYGGPSGTW
jgi:hypothetical protein